MRMGFSILALLLSAGIGAPQDASASRRASWTFAFYCDADSELESRMLRQLERLLPFCGSEEIHVVAFVDRHDESGCKQPIPDGYTDVEVTGVGTWSGGKYLRARRNRFEDLTPHRTGAVDMGRAETLTAFLRFVRRQFPADRTALVMVDHGAGVGGLCIDVEQGVPCERNYESDLSLQDLAIALNAADARRHPLDVLMLDACNMAAVEVLQTVAPFARYVVAAESITFTGFPHHAVLKDVAQYPRAHPRWVATRLGEVYQDESAVRCDGMRRSGRMSVFDMCAFSELEGRLDRLAEALIAAMHSAPDITWARFTRERIRCELIQAGTCMSPCRCSVVDLASLCERLARSGDDDIAIRAAQIPSAVDSTVLCSSFGADAVDRRGVSVYVPCDTEGGWTEFPRSVAAAPWAKFLKLYEPCRARGDFQIGEVLVKLAGRDEQDPKRLVADLSPGARASVEAVLAGDRSSVAIIEFTVVDETGEEIGPRVRVEPTPTGGLSQRWSPGGFVARSGDDRIGLPVTSLFPVSGGRLVGEAAVFIDGRPGVLRFLVTDATWNAIPLHLTFSAAGGWSSREVPSDRDHLVTARPAGSSAKSLGRFLRGTGSVRSTGLRVAYEALPRADYQPGYRATRLDCRESRFLAAPVLVTGIR
jgi:hypothetical protein